jgi:predicted Zn-dependent protease
MLKSKVAGIVMLTVLILVLILGQEKKVYASINGYLGSGYFPTNNLNRCKLGTPYTAEFQNASARWSADTDLNMYYNCTGTHIWTVYADYGDTGWAGYAYICNTNGDCNNSSAFSGTYQSCHARANGYYISRNPDFYTSAEVQKLMTHELGHCYSLDHADVSGSVMSNGSVPNSQDISLIDARY